MFFLLIYNLIDLQDVTLRWDPKVHIKGYFELQIKNTHFAPFYQRKSHILDKKWFLLKLIYSFSDLIPQ